MPNVLTSEHLGHRALDPPGSTHATRRRQRGEAERVCPSQLRASSSGLGPNHYDQDRLALKLAMNSSIGIAASVSTRMDPRELSSAETRAIVWLSGASTTFTKS
jgi:hypothetical protein